MPPMDMPLPTGFTIPAPAMKAVVCDIIFTTMAFAIVCTRIGTRTFMIKNLGLDDYLIIVAMVSFYFFLSLRVSGICAGERGQPSSQQIGKSTYHDNNNNNNTFNRPVHHSVMIDRVRAVPQAHDLGRSYFFFWLC